MVLDYNWAMHELAVTESVLAITLKHAEQANARRVTDIYLVIGKLSSIVDDSVQFYWDMISENSIAQGAVLHFNRIAARMKCLTCGQEFEMGEKLAPCPSCQSYTLKVIAGEEFFVDSIEVEN